MSQCCPEDPSISVCPPSHLALTFSSVVQLSRVSFSHGSCQPVPSRFVDSSLFWHVIRHSKAGIVDAMSPSCPAFPILPCLVSWDHRLSVVALSPSLSPLFTMQCSQYHGDLDCISTCCAIVSSRDIPCRPSLRSETGNYCRP